MRQVSENTGCFDLDNIKDALASCGNVDDATEMIIKRTGQRPAAEIPAQDASTRSCVDVRFKVLKKKRIKVSFAIEARGACENCAADANQPEEAPEAVASSVENSPLDSNTEHSKTEGLSLIHI